MNTQAVAGQPANKGKRKTQMVAVAHKPAKHGATLQRKKDKPIEASDINEFVREAAGGNPNNVEIVPLENVDMKAQFPFPFGNSGKIGGVRNRIQEWIAKGVNGDYTLSTFLNEASKIGHSRTRPVCLLAMLNGGYSTSSKYWGTPYVMLRVKSKTEQE